MMITKTMLLNDVRDANAEFLYEGYQDVDDRNDAMADMQENVMNSSHLISRKDYKSDDDYQDAKEDFWMDGTAELCFVKRDSVLCTALMDFYSPDGTVKDFEKVAKKYINGFYGQMIPESSDDEEGFWFVAGSDYMDSLIPYKMQKAFMHSVNPSISTQVMNNCSSDAFSSISYLLDEDIDDMKNYTGRYVNDDGTDYSIAIDQIKHFKKLLGM